jgi:hypothetical protein
MRLVYIAHPIGGNVEINIKKVLEIVKHLNLTDQSIVPFAPYLVDVMALDDDVPKQRARGFRNNEHLFGLIDEVWLYGDRISSGMAKEIAWAEKLGIPVISKCDGIVL